MTVEDSQPIGVLGDRYEVRGQLGKGAFGQVLHVYDPHLGEEAALKLLGPDQAGGPWDEARMLNSLSGDFILPVRNADVVQGVRYIVTDLAVNGTIGDHVSPHGIAEKQAVKWIRNACSGLDRVHRKGLLHRDLKPQNLFLSGEGDCLVGDLGMCGLQDANGMAEAAGTVTTMAPEVGQVFCDDYAGTLNTYSVRSEVFSLGATLFWMLSGAPPVTGSLPCDVASNEPPDLWTVAPHVSRGVRDIVNRCLERDPNRRFTSPSSLDAALGGRTMSAREWVRLEAHAGHEQCFRGVKGPSVLLACVSPAAGSSKLNIRVEHERSGKRNKVSRSGLRPGEINRGLRSVFRSCE